MDNIYALSCNLLSRFVAKCTRLSAFHIWYYRELSGADLVHILNINPNIHTVSIVANDEICDENIAQIIRNTNNNIIKFTLAYCNKISKENLIDFVAKYNNEQSMTWNSEEFTRVEVECINCGYEE